MRKNKVRGRKYTPENIEHLGPKEIFVFGSNIQGKHIGGAAHTAYVKFGAVWGVGEGLQGQSYALPTLDLETGTGVSTEALQSGFVKLLTTAQTLPEYTFWVTKVGCGIAHRSVQEVRDAFWRAAYLVNSDDEYICPDNVILPREFCEETTAKETLQGELNSLLCTRKKLFNQGRKYTSVEDKERHAGVILDLDAAIHWLEDEIKNAE